MTSSRERLDPIEDALRELDAAEQAGVFRPTDVDVDALVRIDASRGFPSSQSTSHRAVARPLRWLTVAAVVGVAAVGVWALKYTAQISSPKDYASIANKTTTSEDGHEPCDGGILGCLSGPRRTVLASRCLAHDYDADGDVDLADFRTFQLQCEGLGARTR